MSESRVVVEIICRSGQLWSVITSEGQADEFLEKWIKQVEGIRISISGVVQHTDANEVSLTFEKEQIMVVKVMEIKI